MKNIIIIFLLFSTFLFSQRFEHRPEGKEGSLQLRPTITVIPKTDSLLTVYYAYRIPYKFLIFEKNENSFDASVRILIEVYNNDNLFNREFKDEKIVAADFVVTKNQQATYEGFISFNLPDKAYTFKGAVNDLNSKREIHFQPEMINGEEFRETGIFNPIVIDRSNNCSNERLLRIVNHNCSIPFSPNDYQILIPVADTTVKSITVKMKNNDQIIPDKDITDFYVADLKMSECDGKLFLANGTDNTKTKNFVLGNFSQGLDEGSLEMIVSINDEIKEDYSLRVEWFNKPISLKNPELAIEMLKYIENEEVVKKMLDADEDEYAKVLAEYWKKYDPTPETKYNELMKEFYSRIDFAAMEFRNIGKPNGVSTDRGKIYIKFGKPDKIERASNIFGYLVETWTYEKSKQKFQFVDKQGTGNFILIEG